MALSYLQCPCADITLYDADHIDGDVTNNYIDNIQWLTKKENIIKEITIDNKRHIGENNGNSKLTEAIVIQILDDTILGLSPKELSKKYNVPSSAIVDIRTGRTWKYISCKYNLHDIVRSRPKCSKYSSEFNKSIEKLLRTSPDIKNKTICEILNIEYNNKIRCKINNVRNKMYGESSTTIENNDDYYVIEID